MAKPQKSFVCQSCGAVTPRWAGRCESCLEWNTISEETAAASIPKGMSANKKGRVIDFVDLRAGANASYPRYITKIGEFDRVTGGGLVPGSATLIGGDPGIGKSTLLLQVVCALSRNGIPSVYVSGEEAVEQIRMRAERLGLADSPVQLAAATNVRDIIDSVKAAQTPPKILIIDSIQTMYIDNIDSAPGTVTQVRTSAQEIIRMAKSRNIAVLFVGHVTKDGQIAGPRVLEHLVDCVLYFEGDRGHQFRILRAVKNRFGPTNEIGVFEMAQQGLVEVENPSELFLAQRSEDAAGSAVLAALEGTRPLLVEVQALVARSTLAAPRRAVLGWDHNRLAMIVAVLETRCGISLSGHDIFLNIAGGIRIAEPAADVAVAAALISALKNEALPADTVFFGEIGLAGEVRPVTQADIRLKESEKLGFKKAIIPKPGKKADKEKDGKIILRPLTHIRELAEYLG
ncbi:MAG: DNA repair protein RadA [Alphaproteobacteria bacterium]|nr:DNA repair protein RadA [Alphaproteobacteria bacterium]MBP7758680.1 DNA repair protein RadA [Alphaproteobacteria bacterium]MBP7761708.1 DNA repair protein RadA [Alphaproteobacteria bacterium]MBP7903957.1 DNA repair protein RadA [Alphaproteobacteria bacterium]